MEMKNDNHPFDNGDQELEEVKKIATDVDYSVDAPVNHDHKLTPKEENKLVIDDENLKEIYHSSFVEYVSKIPDFILAFGEGEKCLCCMDEGTPWGRHGAGGFLLLPEEQLKSFFEKLHEAGITELTSHDGCGAAGLKYSGLSQIEADAMAADYIKKIAKENNFKYRHISAEEMKRPPNGHIARVAYFDCSGKFRNPMAVNGLPRGFIIGEELEGQEAADNDIAIALKIAFGPHSLVKSKLTKDEPFIIVIMAESEKQVTETQNRLKKITEPYGDLVKFDNFIVDVQDFDQKK